MNGSLLCQASLLKGVTGGIICIFILLIWKGVPTNAGTFNRVGGHIGAYLLPNVIGEGIPRKTKREEDHQAEIMRPEVVDYSKPYMLDSKLVKLPFEYEKRREAPAEKRTKFSTKDFLLDGMDSTFGAVRKRLCNWCNATSTIPSIDSLTYHLGPDTHEHIPLDEKKGSQNKKLLIKLLGNASSEQMSTSKFQQKANMFKSDHVKAGSRELSFATDRVVSVDNMNSTGHGSLEDNEADTHGQPSTEVVGKDTEIVAEVGNGLGVGQVVNATGGRIRRSSQYSGPNNNDVMYDQVANEVQRGDGTDEEAEIDYEKARSIQGLHEWKHFKLILSTIIIVWLCWFLVVCGICKHTAGVAKKAALLGEA